jgi:hypothetical protein
VLFSFVKITGVGGCPAGVFSMAGDTGCTGGVPVHPAKTMRRRVIADRMHTPEILWSMKSIE